MTRQTKLTKAARGRDCQVRLPGCPGDTETVVLAHYRLSGICGTGMKPPDLIGAWACEYCHSLSDGRTNRNTLGMSYDEIRLYNHALTPAEVAANFTAGPDSIVTPPEPVPAPVPDHLWTFTETAASEVSTGRTFTDSLGGVVATLRGHGGSLDGSSLVLPGSSTGNQSAASISAYLDLPNGLISAQNSISLEAWAAPLASRFYQRLFDFGRSNLTSPGAEPGEIIDGAGAPGAFAGYDNLVLSLNVGGNLGNHRLEGQIDNGAVIYSDTPADTVPGTVYHYVLTVTDGAGIYEASGCQAKWFRNGVPQNSLDLPLRISIKVFRQEYTSR